jgi:type IV secretory pathway VirB3-like protein
MLFESGVLALLAVGGTVGALTYLAYQQANDQDFLAICLSRLRLALRAPMRNYRHWRARSYDP